MRPSSRTRILNAAIQVAQREGVTSVTLDSVAAEAGLTKGGLMYHFPSRANLLHGIQEHMATTWEDLIREAAGKPAEEATVEERVAAYVQVAVHSASSADLALIIEGARHPNVGIPWADVAARWTPSPEDTGDDPRMHGLFIARLAADGLWAFESFLQTPLDDDFRTAIVDHIATMITPAPHSTTPAHPGVPSQRTPGADAASETDTT